MRWLIIGSNSFSGASFIDRLISDEHEVVAVSRSEEVAQPFRIYNWHEYSISKSQFQFYQLDINLNLPEIEKLINKTRPQIVVNFAAQSMVGQSWDHPRDWFDTNASSFCEFLQVLTRCDFIEKYIHFSTPEVYGSTAKKITEKSNFNPTTPYAISRSAGDYLVRAYRSNYSLPAVITRASNVYGPGQQLYRLIPKTILMGLNGGKFILDGGGTSDRDFIHIDDVSDALMCLVTTNTNANEFHISTESQIKIIELVKIISDKLGTRLEDFVEIGPDRKGKDQSYNLSSDLLKKQTQWQAKTSIQDGLDGVILWIKQNKTNLNAYPLDYIHKK